MHGARIKEPGGRRDHPQIWILTLPIGGGHLSVAKALARKLTAEGCAPELVSPIARAGWLAKLPILYHKVTTRHTPIWAVYYCARRICLVRELNRRIVRRRLIRLLDALPFSAGDIVILTHSMYCHCLPELRRRRLIVAVLVTDLFGGPLEWFQVGAHRYIVPSIEMKAAAVSKGVPESAIFLRRLPTLVTPSIGGGRVRNEQAPLVRVLLSGGSEGAGPMRLVTNVMAGLAHRFSLTVACGHNGVLKKEIAALDDPRIDAQGYICNLPLMFKEYDLILTKPGSVTIMELLDSAVPFLLMSGIFGIEHGNAKKISEYLAVPILRRRGDVYRILDTLLAKDVTAAARLLTIREGLRRLNNELPAQSVSKVDFIASW